MYKLDLHMHTKSSDGRDTVLDMANAAKEQGLSALVVTDHSIDNSYTANVAVVNELENSVGLPLPVIVGAEIDTPFGELLLYGTKANENWVLYREKLKNVCRDFDHSAWCDMFDKYVLHENAYSMAAVYTTITRFFDLDYAAIIPHPAFNLAQVASIPEKFFKMIHGFEVKNSYSDFRECNSEVINELRELISKHNRCNELINSDAHWANSVGCVYNELDVNITTEHELINWLTKGSLES